MPSGNCALSLSHNHVANYAPCSGIGLLGEGESYIHWYWMCNHMRVHESIAYARGKNTRIWSWMYACTWNFHACRLPTHIKYRSHIPEQLNPFPTVKWCWHYHLVILPLCRQHSQCDLHHCPASAWMTIPTSELLQGSLPDTRDLLLFISIHPQSGCAEADVHSSHHMEVTDMGLELTVYVCPSRGLLWVVMKTFSSNYKRNGQQ